uniref:Uncharacterized protein n=1 Tax=Oryza glumipatula TaxID=40148 RepID=A0A0E0BH23_9ORYZ
MRQRDGGENGCMNTPYPFTLSPSTHPLHSSSPDRLSSSRSPPLATVSDGGRTGGGARWRLAAVRGCAAGDGKRWRAVLGGGRAERRVVTGGGQANGGEGGGRPGGRRGGRRHVEGRKSTGGGRAGGVEDGGGWRPGEQRGGRRLAEGRKVHGKRQPGEHAEGRAAAGQAEGSLATLMSMCGLRPAAISAQGLVCRVVALDVLFSGSSSTPPPAWVRQRPECRWPVLGKEKAAAAT